MGYSEDKTVTQAREILMREHGITKSVAIIRRLCQRGQIDSRKPGNEYLITPQGIEELVAHFTRRRR